MRSGISAIGKRSRCAAHSRAYDVSIEMDAGDTEGAVVVATPSADLARTSSARWRRAVSNREWWRMCRCVSVWAARSDRDKHLEMLVERVSNDSARRGRTVDLPQCGSREQRCTRQSVCVLPHLCHRGPLKASLRVAMGAIPCTVNKTA